MYRGYGISVYNNSGFDKIQCKLIVTLLKAG